jgi:hypothetical protein
MLRRAVLPVLIAFTLTGCGSTATETDKTTESASASAATTTAAPAPAQPKTLEAATAAEQENADRYSSGDYAGQWLLYSSRLRDAISQDDYETFAKRCAEAAGSIEGMRFTVEGVRLDGDSTAARSLDLEQSGSQVELMW